VNKIESIYNLVERIYPRDSFQRALDMKDSSVDETVGRYRYGVSRRTFHLKGPPRIYLFLFYDVEFPPYSVGEEC
jgi:hypothetical protein